MATVRNPRRRGAHQSMQGLAGTAVDMYGGPVIDPTPNVRDLAAADSKRHDDLRAALKEGLQNEARHVKELAKLDREHIKALSALDREHARELDRLRAENIQAAADRAQAAIQALASAKAASNLEFSGRIAALERIASESKGKEAVSDPQLTRLVEDVRSSVRSRERNEGIGKGIQLTGSALAAAVAIMSALGGGLVYVITRTPPGAAVAQAPVVYVQPAPGTLIPSVPTAPQVPQR